MIYAVRWYIWFFNIAMENPKNKWRFLAGKIIYKWTIYTMAMLNNQRVNGMIIWYLVSYIRYMQLDDISNYHLVMTNIGI